MEISTLLNRQIHPSFTQKTDVSSQAFEASSSAFNPSPKDEDKLSVYNGDKFTPKQAFDHFTESGRLSAGVLAVSVEEVLEIELTATEDNIPFDGHSYIDFSTLTTKGQRRGKAKLLKEFAKKRGWLHLSSTDV